MIRALRLLLLGALSVLLGAFHGFVGWHKAFSSREELLRNAAWTIHLPDWLGKAVGWTEMLLTLALMVALFRPSLARLGAAVGVAFVLLNNVVGHLGRLHDWTPWLAAAAPSLLFLTLSLTAYGWLVRYR